MVGNRSPAPEIATEPVEWAHTGGGTLLQGTSGVGPVKAEVPCGARGLIRAVVGGLRFIYARGRAEARESVECVTWPRGHEPGAAAQTRPAVLGPGARPVPGRWASGLWGLAGSAPLIAQPLPGLWKRGWGRRSALWPWNLAGP